MIQGEKAMYGKQTNATKKRFEKKLLKKEQKTKQTATLTNFQNMNKTQHE